MKTQTQHDFSISELTVIEFLVGRQARLYSSLRGNPENKWCNKFVVLLVIFISLANFCSAQSRVPEPVEEAPSAAFQYYSNSGQIADDTGGLHPEVLYYTEHGAPSVFLTEKGAHFVAYETGTDTTSDSSFRITMNFKCPGYPSSTCGSIQTYEPGIDTLNYYLPHCATGVTGVAGFSGIRYASVFNNIDVDFYSNGNGIKNFITFNPGSDPSNFILKFSGQDSIVVIDSILQAYVYGHLFTVPIIDAYEVDNSGNFYSVSWNPTWVDFGNGEIGLNVGTYDPGHRLIIRIGVPVVSSTSSADGNLDWSTYYGASTSEISPAIFANDNKEIYHVMSINGGVFPKQDGPNSPSSSSSYGLGHGLECYISKFNQYGVRQWATYYGGSDADFPKAIIESAPTDPDGGGIFVGGYTTSTDLPLGSSSSFQKGYGGNEEGFIASFLKQNGKLNTATYFGGNGDDRILTLAADNANNKIYFGGLTSTSTNNSGSSCSVPSSVSQFPLCPGSGSRYFQSTIGATYNGFIGSIDGTSHALTWSTYLPGSDDIGTIAVSNYGGGLKVYVSGRTTQSSASFLTNPGSSAYYQTTRNGLEGYICRFNSSFQIDWGTYWGGLGSDGIYKISVGGTSSDVYIAGTTSSSTPSSNTNTANSSGYFPLYHGTGAYWQSYGGGSSDAFIARFSAFGVLQWSTYFGGSDADGSDIGDFIPNCDLAIANNGDVFLSSWTTGDIQAFTAAGYRNQAHNASYSLSQIQPYDGWLAQFNSSNGRIWASHFGGSLINTTSTVDPVAYEVINAIAVAGTTHINLYATGTTSCDNTPHIDPNPVPGGGTAWYQGTYSTATDAFLSRYGSIATVGINGPATSGQYGEVSVKPNPSSGIFEISYQSSKTTVSASTVIVMNGVGQVMFKEIIPLSNKLNKFTIDLRAKPSGIYLLSIDNDAAIQIVKE